MIKVGFSLIGSKNWMGGHTYLRNLSSIIKLKLKNKVHSVFIYCDDDNLENVNLSLFDQIIRIKTKRSIFHFFFNFRLSKIIDKEIDVFFDSNNLPFLNKNKKVLSWLADFQHKNLPNFFSFIGYWKREISFKKKTFFHKNIMVSSNNAKNDCITFYKKEPKDIHVVKFSVFVNPEDHLDQISYLKSKYKINNNFIYIPNQFWKHKNHNLILDCIEYLKAEKTEIYNQLPQIIFTGPAIDYRNKGHAKKLVERMNSKIFNNKIYYLGVIPLEDVYKLNANCLYLVNPSFFEGWSTTVEEAKSFGTPTLLSDIKVHREQSPNSIFFNPRNKKDLAQLFCDIVDNRINLQRDDIKIILSKNELRKSEHANSFLNALEKTIDSYKYN